MVTKKKHTVLFVDDEQRVLKSLKRGLIGESYRCLFAVSGMEALEILAEKPVEVIVSDMKMPEMNGLELLQEVARRHPDTIRLVLSGYSHTNTVLAAVNEGRIFRYITKPWSIEHDIKPALESAFALYERRIEEHLAAERLRFDNQLLQNELDSGRKTISKTKKVASSIYRRKINTQLRGFERVEQILNFVSSQAINLEMGELDPDSRKLAAEIKHTCRDALLGIERIKLLGALEMGERKPKPEAVKLPQFFSELEASVKKSAAASNLTIFFQLSDNLPEMAVSDADLLRVMLDETLKNALQNSPPGGIIVCEVDSEKIDNGSKNLTIKIRDTGPGIASEHLKELTRPFSCGASGNRRLAWGIGLNLARLIATRLEGSIKIDSPDQGCQVTLTVKVRVASEESEKGS